MKIVHFDTLLPSIPEVVYFGDADVIPYGGVYLLPADTLGDFFIAEVADLEDAAWGDPDRPIMVTAGRVRLHRYTMNVMKCFHGPNPDTVSRILRTGKRFNELEQEEQDALLQAAVDTWYYGNGYQGRSATFAREDLPGIRRAIQDALGQPQGQSQEGRVQQA